jgi:hypothetical protein
MLERVPWATVSWMACAMALVATFLTSPHSVVSLALYYSLFMFCYAAIDGRAKADVTRASGVFAFYVLGTLALYWTQYLAYPQYFGFSGGPGVGTGTDDAFFYSLAAPELPEGFRLRDYYFRSFHTYGVLLRGFSEPLYKLYGEFHPLDLLFFNTAGLALVPFLVRNTARLITGDETMAGWAFALSLICPFMMANGLILLRDGLMATCFIAATYGLLGNRFVLLGVALFGAAWLRPAQGVMLLGSLWMLSMFVWVGTQTAKEGGWRPKGMTVAALSVAPVLVALLAYVFVGTALLEKLLAVKGLFRESFLYDFVRESALSVEGPDTFYAINQLSLPLRLPLAFAFYFGVPYVALETFMTSGPLVPRYMLNSIYGVMFIVYAGWFLRGVIRAWDTTNVLVLGLVVTYCIDLLILSQASMEARHKTGLMPLMYIVVAYGARYRQRDAVILGLLFSFGFGAMVLLYNGYKLWNL